MHWKKLSSEYISQHPYFTARKDRCQMPDGKIVEAYFLVEMPLSVCALAITDDDKVILTKQYRHPIGKTILEIPGGFIDEHEAPAEAIKRELLEETGYTFSSITEVGKIAANPGVLSNYTQLYLAKGGKKTATQRLDATEDIEVILIPLQEVKEMLYRNEFAQALHVTCMFYALRQLDIENQI